jgi:predicted transcriptional regulator
MHKTMRIEEHLAGRLRRAAELRGMSESDIMREAIAEKVDAILRQFKRSAWEDANTIIDELGLDRIEPLTNETYSDETGARFADAMVAKHDHADR